MNGQARARKLVSAAIAAGTLTRPDACEQCGQAPERDGRHPLDAHHVTYSRPLDVTWLCASCHRLAHPRRPPADAELRANPARSDRLIASLTGVEHHAVGRARQRLEQAGEIPPVPVRARVPRYPNGPRQLGRAQQAVLDLGPGCTTREVMDRASVGREAAWHARTHPRVLQQHPLADLAAAVDQLSVVRTSARSTRLRVGNDLPPGYYAPPDPVLDLACCTAEYTATGWQHDRACALRLAAR